MTDSALDIVRRLGLTQISDPGELEELVDDAMVANPKAVHDFMAGRRTVVNFLVAQVMRQSHGKANPKLTAQIVSEKLAQVKERQNGNGD